MTRHLARWADLSRAQFAAIDRSRTIAVLPVGAIEQHGPHLPVSVDRDLAEAVLERSLEHLPTELPVLAMPGFAYGKSNEHGAIPGTISLSAETMLRLLTDIAASLARTGFRRFVMLNAHGGNSPLMTIVATELRVRLDMLAVATSWTRFGYPPDLVSPEEKAIGIHGGFIETSVMLALRPDLVDMSKARDFTSMQAVYGREFSHLRAYGPHAFGWKMSDLSSEGVVGNAAAATAEAGEMILDHAAQGLAELLDDIARFDLSRLT